MNLPLIKRRKFWLSLATFLVLVPAILFGVTLVYVYQNQDSIVQTEIATINKGYHGEIQIGSTELAPFRNFPYVSIVAHDVKVLESKEAEANSILEVADVYIGLELTDLLTGKIDIKKLVIEEGFFDFILYEDGSDNLTEAFVSEEDSSDSEPLHVHLQFIELKNFDIRKRDFSNGLEVQGRVFWANGGFETAAAHTKAHIDTEFELNIISNGDTTFVKHKHFEFHTDVDLDESTGIMAIAPSGIKMEFADFMLSGTVDTKNHFDLDLDIEGTKPNFDLFIAFAPAEVVPVLERYKNAGKIFFKAMVSGPSTIGYDPAIDVKFGASEAYLENIDQGRRVDNLGFVGHFSNGEERNPSTMEFSIENMTARLGEGDFAGAIMVKNFQAPEIDMTLDSEFDLDFIAEFLNLNNYTEASGSIDLHLKFHDVIDLEHPERALNKLNQAYYSELTVKDLTVKSVDLPAPLRSLDAHLVMKGERAELDQFELKLGDSDLSINGYLSNLPAIIHQTSTPIKAHLDVQADVLDVAQLTRFSEIDSSGVNERIEDLALGLSFNSTARDLAVFSYLPKGEFFVDSLHAKLSHYPHALHDFHVDILIDESDMQIKDFIGFVDDSDFHLNGHAHDYSFWMKDSLEGDVQLDLGLESELLRLEDLFSYQGENFVPEGYRHEEFDNLKLHLKSNMHYESSSLKTIDVDLDQFDAKMHLHPMRFQDFRGRFHYEDDRLLLEDFHAQIGRSVFNIDMSYHLGEDSLMRQGENYLTLKTNYIDFDQLTNFNLDSPRESKEALVPDSTSHAEAYNLYELPFSNMKFDVEVGHFIYHRLDLQEVDAELRTTVDHYLYVDTLSLNAAGGSVAMNGYFNGSDPEHIYLKPNLVLEDVDLDKLLFKFENFGQDAIVSENLHGQLSTTITGNIRVYPDFVPNLDESEVHMDVFALNGRLENYDYMLMLSDYFGDKNLNSVRFDTLQNHLDMVDGVLTIPAMTIESTLGHIEISGTQDLEENIEYYVRIPWSLIRQGAVNRVFGKKNKEGEETSIDEILEVDPDEKIRYLNLKITGTLDEFKIRPGKDKKKKKKSSN
ncbi:MAG: hypothetical protein MK086_14490 [Flavobacteriales bacterium]|nr:hypothetical protein [Flavobacteriales bacterium]